MNNTQTTGFSHYIGKHLKELRERLIRCVIFFSLIFALCSLNGQWLYTSIATPLVKSLPESSSMIATSVISPFFTPIKLSAYISLYLSIPYVLYQSWLFISPGLYEKEKKFVSYLFISGVFLFYMGMVFSFTVAFPMIFKFMVYMTPQDTLSMPDIHEYLSFVLQLFLAFGIIFQMPIVIIGLIRFNLVSAKTLASHRRYIIVIALIAGMLLTPPDVISQILVALPLYALFEIGLWIGRYFDKSD